MPVQQVASMAATFQSGIASLERVVELLDVDEISADPEPVPDPPPTRGRVVFDDVHFSYEPDKPLITGLDLTAEPGQTVAIVGPTGAGQDHAGELAAALLRTRRRAHHPRRARHHRPSPPRAAVGSSAWCSRTPGCSATPSGRTSATATPTPPTPRSSRPPGSPMSIGSSPRCPRVTTPSSTTRATTSPPARSSCSPSLGPSSPTRPSSSSTRPPPRWDTRTEVLIQEAMNALRADRTSFVIAHRLSTIRGADTIVVMDGGRIAEQGSHEELLARAGPYADLHAAQFAGQAT